MKRLIRDIPIPLTRNDSLDSIDFEAGAALLIDKPKGITSFGVVQRVRSLIGIRKVGHTGTLDPLATGLLILLTGKATRSQNHFMSLDKEYLATILLGMMTDTWDMDGKIVAEAPVPSTTKDRLIQLINERFVGTFKQMPPAFSSIKQNGVPSYKRARKGQQVKLDPRQVTLHNFSIEEWSPEEFTIRLDCSSGFYVRSLAHDIGEAIGCGGTLKSLIRKRIDTYQVDDALTLGELAAKIKR
ncbi:tRNA pseudouridine(55) synthase TruB [candidate division LCP-89 bacterium B3_LCP]|uniref:tRNA pseudouridine synthase B n=1 Tax=candidate division LCP-89 bacterium B3_LCP TaxID=2012998 RepID=A0A532V3D4_UNCL8|nr:MAG: tRNA pseudouridine(55) synthase TruB [candidate division LCP-89 bacterium B3_LCP]